MFLGLDLGTSAIKALLISSDGEAVAEASVAVEVSNPEPGWSEQNPEHWWLAIKQSLQLLSQQTSLHKVQAIGVAGQMHGATLVDVDGQVLRPCILWNDGRSQAQCVELEAALSDFRERSGNLAMPGFTAPKVLWVKQNEPEVFACTAKVLLPKDYITYRLTGLFSSEMSDAAGTLWLDPQTRAWDEALLEASALSSNQMPELFEGCDIVGHLKEDIAAELSLPVVPVVAGAGDNAAGAIGIGAVEPGDAFVSLGTSGVYFVVSDQHCAAPEQTVHAFCHCLPNLWHQMSVSLSAANSLNWLARQLDKSENELVAALESSDLRQTSVVFLPYLSGERTPHNDANANGQFFGLTNSTSSLDLTLAVLEGVAFSFLDGEQALEAGGANIGSVSLLGGGVRSSLWGQIIADVLQRPMILRDGATAGPALGAARLAQIGYETAAGGQTALSDERLQTICAKPAELTIYQPSNEASNYYQSKVDLYRRLYQQTKDLNDQWREL